MAETITVQNIINEQSLILLPVGILYDAAGYYGRISPTGHFGKDNYSNTTMVCGSMLFVSLLLSNICKKFRFSCWNALENAIGTLLLVK
jgi:hypothetical protein